MNDDEMEPSRPRFDLVRHYTLASLVVLTVFGLTILVLVSYWIQESYLYTEREAADNLAEEIATHLESTGFTLQSAAGATAPTSNPTLRHLLENFGIRSVELFSPDGTSILRIGSAPYAPADWSAGREAAGRGQPSSRWNPEDWAFLSVLRNSGSWVESYAPIRAAGKIVGVAYLRRDWNAVLSAEHRVWTPVLYTALGGGLLIFLALWLIVHRAGQQIGRQQDEIFAANRRLQTLVEQLRDANRSLARMDLQKDHFLAVCSHDIRSPLIGVVAGCRLLLKGKQGPLTEKQREIVETGLRAAQNVLDMTTTLLDLARIENGAEQLVVEPLDLSALLRQSCEAHRWAADAKQVQLRLSLPLQPVMLEGDRLKLLRVCNNLMSNAVKYSLQGTEVCVELAAKADRAIFSVKDQGPGISKEDQALLFDRFSRLARHKRTREEGTGLGLAITLGLVRLHCGTIDVESEPGRGSTFRVVLPVRHPHSTPAARNPSASCAAAEDLIGRK